MPMGKRTGERGAILPLVLVFLALGLLLLTPALNLGFTSLVSTTTTEAKALELHAADAGVEDAYTGCCTLRLVIALRRRPSGSVGTLVTIVAE
jgi:hypothetical protein